MQTEESEHQNQRNQGWKHNDAFGYIAFEQQLQRPLTSAPRTFEPEIFLIETRNIEIVTDAEHTSLLHCSLPLWHIHVPPHHLTCLFGILVQAAPIVGLDWFNLPRLNISNRDNIKQTLVVHFRIVNVSK